MRYACILGGLPECFVQKRNNILRQIIAWIAVANGNAGIINGHHLNAIALDRAYNRIVKAVLEFIDGTACIFQCADYRKGLALISVIKAEFIKGLFPGNVKLATTARCGRCLFHMNWEKETAQVGVTCSVAQVKGGIPKKQILDVSRACGRLVAVVFAKAMDKYPSHKLFEFELRCQLTDGFCNIKCLLTHSR